MQQQDAGAGTEPGSGRVSAEEIQAAMGVNSVPDEVRTASDDPDETASVMDAEGDVRPADPAAVSVDDAEVQQAGGSATSAAARADTEQDTGQGSDQGRDDRDTSGSEPHQG